MPSWIPGRLADENGRLGKNVAEKDRMESVSDDSVAFCPISSVIERVEPVDRVYHWHLLDGETRSMLWLALRQAVSGNFAEGGVARET